MQNGKVLVLPPYSFYCHCWISAFENFEGKRSATRAEAAQPAFSFQFSFSSVFIRNPLLDPLEMHKASFPFNIMCFAWLPFAGSPFSFSLLPAVLHWFAMGILKILHFTRVDVNSYFFSSLFTCCWVSWTCTYLVGWLLLMLFQFFNSL